MASGIVAACLSVSPKFFQKLWRTKAVSEVKFFLDKFFTSFTSALRSSTRHLSDETSIGDLARPGKRSGSRAWSLRYETTPDDQRVANSLVIKPVSSSDQVKDSLQMGFIRQTVDIETFSEPMTVYQIAS